MTIGSFLLLHLSLLLQRYIVRYLDLLQSESSTCLLGNLEARREPLTSYTFYNEDGYLSTQHPKYWGPMKQPCAICEATVRTGVGKVRCQLPAAEIQCSTEWICGPSVTQLISK
ncbi:hypothetical protein B0H65DRAFT_447926 [Neurospora tetraspora]|uniref:Uncharacterized protein n=1 Tax=Neurospora tetraspora TaxID=94610 RepID=A0AAE0JN01_9PEZI|nr:hypothetical protein B0H65DRAFT_447926 [Neurospora tetraspora]